jgi:hypothetical protein
LTGDQHTDHIENGQRVSRHSLPTLLYFLFSPPHIFLIQFYCHRTNEVHEHQKTIINPFVNGTFGFARHTSQPFAKPKEPFFANAPTNRLTIIQTVFILKNEIDKIINLSLRTHFKMT